MTIDERRAEILLELRAELRVALSAPPPDALKNWRPPAIAPAYVSPNQGAALLTVSVATIYRLVETGALAHVRLGGTERRGGRGMSGIVRIPLPELARFLSEREIGALRVAPAPVSQDRIARDLRAAQKEKA